jgi:8-oxo-dGDP phosphatase
MLDDQPVDIQALERKLIHSGMIWDLVSETFQYSGQELTREFIDHPGAVAVLAINSKAEILMIRQYRRPVGKYLMEIPAGLLDVSGESRVDCARRELFEEGGLEADTFEELISFYSSPGGSSENIFVYLATGLKNSDAVFIGEGEEKDLERVWVPIRQALRQVLESKVMSPSAQVAIMAYCLKYGISSGK